MSSDLLLGRKCVSERRFFEPCSRTQSIILAVYSAAFRCSNIFFILFLLYICTLSFGVDPVTCNLPSTSSDLRIPFAHSAIKKTRSSCELNRNVFTQFCFWYALVTCDPQSIETGLSWLLLWISNQGSKINVWVRTRTGHRF